MLPWILVATAVTAYLLAVVAELFWFEVTARTLLATGTTLLALAVGQWHQPVLEGALLALAGIGAAIAVDEFTYRVAEQRNVARVLAAQTARYDADQQEDEG